MNEQLINFAKLAGFELPEYWGIEDRTSLKKFAELIIQECCTQMLELEVKYPANLTVLEIKRHFGVTQ